MANYIRNLGKIAGAIFMVCFFVGTIAPASAAVFTFDLADHPDRAVANADYGIRLDQIGPDNSADHFYSFNAPGGAQLTVDTMANGGLGSVIIGGVVSENNSNGVQQGLWNLNYEFTGLFFGADGAFTATGGSGTLSRTGFSDIDLTSLVSNKAPNVGLAFRFSNEVYRGFDGWNGRGWIVGGGTNDFLFTASLNDPGQSTAVPIPAALPLLLSGIGLMGWVSRRRRRTAVTA